MYFIGDPETATHVEPRIDGDLDSEDEENVGLLIKKDKQQDEELHYVEVVAEVGVQTP